MALYVRNFLDSDSGEIDRIWKLFHKTSFGIPELNGNLHAVIDGSAGEGLIAYGMIKPYAELIMVLDLAKSGKIKVEGLKKLLNAALLGASYNGYEQLHAFVHDENFSRILKKHFGFQAASGEALVINL